MRNISDIIEQYLKQVIDLSNNNVIEIKRNEIADRFECVPSQINYVINTRFTLERGFVVESKRGGGGYIRIIKVKLHDDIDIIDQMLHMIDHSVAQGNAESMIIRLLEEGIITGREAKLMLSVLDRSVLSMDIPSRDELRARILCAMLRTLKYK
ncbi:TPA: transcriptional regulator CtsR [Bacillus thuringiensis]|jgi:transcriptional regulator CtsR|uniref:Transcriptional regulator CtsR n=15 Tax=Bacilli TaxID=91061 RepID=Q81J69_BACCR|nr:MULTISPECIES: transcriptional regulator CtsR [Bacteria]ANN30293.1 CtsR family transcriptional regulator [Bacillus thuringiensis serovar coreanensis]MBJ6720224.1 transcriptional regulator CtsR [Bacillus sp. PR5]MBR3335993.1 transcriptional regulator CtsR [Bacillus sp. (in: firmicutes)]MCU7387619.1 transcriptional regulator CtsR [Bacillus sp. ST24]MDV8115721.1 transcriptional regulator CtsR [Bacillus sp. BAU-SS-2023]NIE94666.1 transcriptional regulator CtsR [Bacillus sp. Ab-1751]OUB21135.1 